MSKIAIIFCVALLLGSIAKVEIVGDAADIRTETTATKKINWKESAAVKFGLFGIPSAAGYMLQPESNEVYKGEKLILHTKPVRPLVYHGIFEEIPREHNHWAISTDNINWKVIEGTRDLKINTDKEGVFYFQHRTFWTNDNIQDPKPRMLVCYSKVAVINVRANPENARSIEVQTENDYLYNNQSQPTKTFAHSIITPKSATGNMSWTIDNEKIATIDKETGEITSSSGKNQRSGKVLVTGTFVHSDGTNISDSAEIIVGGGLENQTASIGDKVRFLPQGIDYDLVKTITYTVDQKGKKSTVIKRNKIREDNSLIINKVSMEDDDLSVSARVEFKDPDNNKAIDTNIAVLNVVGSMENDIKMSLSVRNESFGSQLGFLDHAHQVTTGDILTTRGRIIQQNSNATSKDGTIQVKLPHDVQISKVILDDLTIEEGQYFHHASDTGSVIEIPQIVFTNERLLHSFEISYKICKLNSASFSSDANFVYLDETKSESDQITSRPIKIGFTDNQVHFNCEPITFESFIGKLNSQELKAMMIKRNNELSLFKADNRRGHPETHIDLRVKQPLTNNGMVMNSNFRFYDMEKNFKTIPNDGTYQRVFSTEDGENLAAINWNEKLRLFIPKGNIPAGEYKAILDWQITDSC